MIAGINPEATCLCAGCTTAKRVFLGKDRIPVEQSIHLEQEAKAKTRGIQAGDSSVAGKKVLSLVQELLQA